MLSGDDTPPQQALELLDDNLLALCFSSLDDVRDVVALRAVCRAWRDAVDARDVDERVFCNMWGLRRLNGERRSSRFLAGVKLRNFVFAHACAPSDTLPGIALRYGVSVLALRQLNNCAEPAFKSRQHVYVPVTNGRSIEGRDASIVRDAHSLRELVVVDQEPPGAPPSGGRPARDEARARLAVDLLSRSLGVDGGTAEFYFHQAGGDLKEAMQQYEADRVWERQQGRRRGRAPRAC